MSIHLQQVTKEDSKRVYEIIRRAPEYFKKVDGLDEVTIDVAEMEIWGGPSKRDPEYEKVFLVASDEGRDIGVVDLHVNHREKGSAYIGLLLLAEEEQGRGLGREMYRELEKWIASRYRINRLQLGVSEDNDVEEYWKKMGFERNGNTYVWRGSKKSTNVFEMEKRCGVQSGGESC